jgi:hypothetical protein
MIRDKDGNVVRNEVGSVDVNELPRDAAAQAAPGGEEDLASLYKADLVDRAEAAGIDTSGMKKADIVAALEQESAGATAGDESSTQDETGEEV